MSVISKGQSCGKKNCRCVREGKLHGPYWWFVWYEREEKRYRWKYLGKDEGKARAEAARLRREREGGGTM